MRYAFIIILFLLLGSSVFLASKSSYENTISIGINVFNKSTFAVISRNGKIEAKFFPGYEDGMTFGVYPSNPDRASAFGAGRNSEVAGMVNYWIRFPWFMAGVLLMVIFLILGFMQIRRKNL